jgi:hypothetical protein
MYNGGLVGVKVEHAAGDVASHEELAMQRYLSVRVYDVVQRALRHELHHCGPTIVLGESRERVTRAAAVVPIEKCGACMQAPMNSTIWTAVAGHALE